MDREHAIEKIKKCLNLSKSSEPAESAAALRQAKILMDKYGVEQTDIDLSDVMDAYTNAPCQKPNKWQLGLLAIVCHYFGVEAQIIVGRYFDADKTSAEYRLIGIDPKPVIAEHAYIVLYRQLARDRQQYIKTHLKRCKTANKTARANAFCEAWLSAVTNHIKNFAGISDADQALITKFKQLEAEQEQSTLEPVKVRKGKNHSTYADHAAGYDAGSNARLEHGLGSSERKRIG